jgi:Zn-dependent protease with chaperone function
MVARRAVLVLALWAGFWLLALTLILFLLWIPFIQLQTHMELSGFVALGAAFTLAWALRPRSKNKQDGKAEPLSRERAQALYKMVERIGRKLGVLAPVEIHLVGTATAFISAKRNWLGRVTHLQVGLGLPLLGTLTEAELGSVIAHEFGHFVGGDLSLGPWVYRTRLALAHTVNELDDSMFFLDILFRGYFTWFLRLSSQVSRQQEYWADATAARCFGIPATRAALEKIHLIDPMWSSYLDHELGPAIGRGARLPIFAGFKRFCQAGLRREVVQQAIDWSKLHSDEYRITDQFDSHPSLSDRVAALVPGSKPGLPPPAQCFALLGGEAATEALWYDSLELEKARETDWDRFGAEILQVQVCERFAGSWMDPQQLSLDQLPATVNDLDGLWKRLKPEGVSFLSRGGKHNHVLEILEEWLIACLCHNGFVPQVLPGQELLLQRTLADGTRQGVQPAKLLAQAQAGTLSAATLAGLAGIPATDATATDATTTDTTPSPAPTVSLAKQAD